MTVNEQARVDAAHVDLADLRMLVVLSEELHFGRAATRLDLSQPGLTYRVQRLEAALGYEVLVRSPRGVSLTAAGEVLLTGAQRVLGEATRALEDADRVARGEAASLRVGFVGTALYSVLPPVLRTARDRHPDLRLVIEERKTATSLGGLRLGQLDLALVHLPIDDSAGVDAIAVWEEAVGIALRAGHRLTAHDTLRLEQLADEPFALFPRELEPHTYDRYVNACVRAGFAPRVADHATGLQTILGLVAAGLGVAFVAASVAANLTRSGVVFRPLADDAVRLTTGVAWAAGEPAPAVALLRDLVVEITGDQRA